MSYKACEKIINFLTRYDDIKIDLFNTENSVEEFAFQTISVNENEPFYYIGNGCCSEETIPPNNIDTENKKFVYKVRRE